MEHSASGGAPSIFGSVALPLDSKHTQGAQIPMPIFDEGLNMKVTAPYPSSEFLTPPLTLPGGGESRSRVEHQLPAQDQGSDVYRQKESVLLLKFPSSPPRFKVTLKVLDLPDDCAATAAACRLTTSSGKSQVNIIGAGVLE